MKTTTFTQFVLLTLSAFAVASPHDGRVNLRHHEQVARSNKTHLTRRCKSRQNVEVTAQNNDAHKDTKVDNKSSGDGGNKNNGNKQSSNTSHGLISATSDRCGDSGATEEVTKTTGPNGSIDWLNCGLESGSWNPPKITVDQIKAVGLRDALKDSGSPFHACKDYIDLFEEFAGEHGFPSIVLASIAMQESSCKASTEGGAGEQGLMQITKDKCGGAPGGNCKDPRFNIKTGADYLQTRLNDFGGDFLLALGSYNGWQKGMDIGRATTWYGGNCRTQNNLDYLFQSLNGWYQNKNVYNGGKSFGRYFNLDVCGN